MQDLWRQFLWIHDLWKLDFWSCNVFGAIFVTAMFVCAMCVIAMYVNQKTTKKIEGGAVQKFSGTQAVSLVHILDYLSQLAHLHSAKTINF